MITSSFGKNRPAPTPKELRRKRFIIGGMAVIIFIALRKFLTYRNSLIPLQLDNIYNQNFDLDPETLNDWRNLSKTQMSQMSHLGHKIYLEPSSPLSIKTQPSNFTIVVWNYNEKNVQHPHLLRLANEIKNGPLKNCSVQNCKITVDPNQISNSSAILFPLELLDNLPENRTKDQIWIAYFDQIPEHILRGRSEKFLQSYRGIFNWTMSYQLIADIPVAFGRTILKSNFQNEHFPYIKNKVLSSHLITTRTLQCQHGSLQWDYLKELRFYMEIEIFGKCGNKTDVCTDRYKNCNHLRGFKFYLAFENFNTVEYFSEDIWWNAYDKNLIPIVMGPSLEQCQRMLPINSFIHVDMFKNPQELYDHLIFLLGSHSAFNSYFRWKKYFSVVNEHGYANTNYVQFCRICEALNYNDKQPKTVWNLEVLLKNYKLF